MTANTTYYAILNEDGILDRPVGVFRRVKNGSGQLDEVFSRNLKWEFSTRYDFAEITEVEANQIVDRIRAESSAG